MTDRQKFEIQRIIYWKNKIAKIKTFLVFANEKIAFEKFFKKSYGVKLVGKYKEVYKRSIELDEEMFLMFYDWLSEYKKHLQTLVESSDQELVDIADAVRNEEITKEGLRY